MNTISVPLDQLNDTVLRCLRNLGLATDEAKVVCEILMYAQKRNSTQGLGKIRERTVLPDTDCTDVEVIKRSAAVATVDGGGHTGMYVTRQAVITALDLIKTCGLALVNTRNTRSSTGAVGYYARQLAEQGYIAIVMGGSPKVMAVEGGIDPVMGTNPVAFAIPTGDSPLVFDMATSVTTWFALIDARNNQQEINEGIAVDQDGYPTTDPVKAMAGAMRTIAGPKGSGLALMIEMLTAPLAAASIAGDKTDNRANTIIAINPAVVLGNDSFYSTVDLLINRIKSGRCVPGNNAIRLPGENSDAIALHCEQSNSISLDETLYKHILEISEQ